MLTRLLTLAIAAALYCTAQAQDSLAIGQLSRLSYSENINEVWGYAHNGREFALIGTQSGVSIVEVSDPANPVEKHFITGASSIWRDIKSWSHYAFVVHDSYASSDTSDGIRIIDLSTIDSAVLSYSAFYPTVVSQGVSYDYDRAHNIFIDENGVLYVFGSNAGSGGALMFDLSSNPVAPQYLGEASNNYYHDGMVRGDTLWAAAVYAGQFEVVDVSNKSNPVVMATQKTPYNFCHNVWVSDNNQRLFTTDEKSNAPVAAFDVSDLNNISLLDTIRTSLRTSGPVIPHNTHVLGDFLVTSYYTAGLQIVDASQPDILVETAWFDSSPFSGPIFEGVWGAYPYLPSKNILISDQQQGLFVLSTNYPRASFLTLTVKDSLSGLPLANAQLNLINTAIYGKTDIFGNFKAGQRDSGSYKLWVSKTGYQNDTVWVHMNAGSVLNKKLALLPLNMGEAESEVAPLRIFPNPIRAGQSLQIECGANADELDLTIQALDGRLCYRQPQALQPGLNDINPGLAAGVYFVHIRKNGQSINQQKIVVSN